MAEKQPHNLGEIKSNGGYKLGMVEAKLRLPKGQTVNLDGTIVTFAPEQNHIPYLKRSNEWPMLPILKSQEGIYGTINFSDGRLIAIASSYSPYVLEGEHLILWALSGDNFRFQPNVNYLSTEQGQKLFSTAANLARVYEKKGLTYFIGINSNEKEYERQSVQSIRDGAHVHCVGLDPKDIDHFEEIQYRDEKRILDDPFARLSNRLLEKLTMPQVLRLSSASDMFEQMISYDEYPYKYPTGTSLVLRQGLDSLKHPEFFPLIQKIHQTLEADFNKLVKCFTDQSFDTFRAKVDDEIDTISFFRRPIPLSREEIKSRLEIYFKKHPELVDDRLIVNGLGYLANVIKPASQVVLESATGFDEITGVPKIDAKTINSRIIMNGLSYNMMIFRHPDTGKTLLSFVPRVTTGGSPLDAIGIKKEQYSVPVAQFKEHLALMDQKLDATVSELLETDKDITPGEAFNGSPKEKPAF